MTRLPAIVKNRFFCASYIVEPASGQAHMKRVEALTLVSDKFEHLREGGETGSRGIRREDGQKARSNKASPPMGLGIGASGSMHCPRLQGSSRERYRNE
jgi:hypothetical protein